MIQAAADAAARMQAPTPPLSSCLGRDHRIGRRVSPDNGLISRHGSICSEKAEDSVYADVGRCLVDPVALPSLPDAGEGKPVTAFRPGRAKSLQLASFVVGLWKAGDRHKASVCTFISQGFQWQLSRF